MKTFPLLLITLFFAPQDHGGKVKWSKAVQDSLNRAAKEGKPAILFFTASW